MLLNCKCDERFFKINTGQQTECFRYCYQSLNVQTTITVPDWPKFWVKKEFDTKNVADVLLSSSVALTVRHGNPRVFIWGKFRQENPWTSRNCRSIPSNDFLSSIGKLFAGNELDWPRFWRLKYHTWGKMEKKMNGNFCFNSFSFSVISYQVT